MNELSELGEAFKAYRESRKEKKAFNLRKSTNLLKFLNIPFISHNNGVHLVVSHDNKTIDFYPSPGLWIDRLQKDIKHRVIKTLLQYINVKLEKTK